jgi:hypothetical protein
MLPWQKRQKFEELASHSVKENLKIYFKVCHKKKGK